jgi:hypothetical protein
MGKTFKHSRLSTVPGTKNVPEDIFSSRKSPVDVKRIY